MNTDILISKNYEQGKLTIGSDRLTIEHSMIEIKEVLYQEIKTVKDRFLLVQSVVIEIQRGSRICFQKFETYQAREIVQLIQSCRYIEERKNEEQGKEKFESNI